MPTHVRIHRVFGANPQECNLLELLADTRVCVCACVLRCICGNAHIIRNRLMVFHTDIPRKHSGLRTSILKRFRSKDINDMHRRYALENIIINSLETLLICALVHCALDRTISMWWRRKKQGTFFFRQSWDFFVFHLFHFFWPVKKEKLTNFPQWEAY